MLKRLKETKEEILTLPYLRYILWLIFLLIFVYLTLVAFFNEKALPPNGDLFHMFCLFILAHLFGKIFHIINLPSLLGMLGAGILYGNLVELELDKQLLSTIRSLALLIILLRAGLHLIPEYLRYLSFSAIRVIAIPFFAETFIVAICSIIFFQFTFMWSLLIGFVMSAVSPAVVVPCMIRIQQSGLSEGKGIPTLNIAAASIDDVLSVTGFNIFLGFAIPTEKSEHMSLTMKIIQGPLQIVIGIAFGLIMGWILWYLPETYDKCDKNDSKKHHISRFSLLLMAGMFALFGSIYVEMEAAGPMAILIMAFVATIKWRENCWEEDNEHSLKIIWLILKRFLFCLIGCELKFQTLDADIVGKAIGCLMIGIVLKIIVTYLVTFNIGLNHKERLFIAFAWMPKATVQAAIGPTALSIAQTDSDIQNGKVILTAAALSILITAPLGAICMDFLCTRLLTKPKQNDNNNNIDTNNNNIPIINNHSVINITNITNTNALHSPTLSVKRFTVDLDL